MMDKRLLDYAAHRQPPIPILIRNCIWQPVPGEWNPDGNAMSCADFRAELLDIPVAGRGSIPPISAYDNRFFPF
jgi:hypothetical protein